MVLDDDAILRRLDATMAVQEKVADAWVWEEKAAGGWSGLKDTLEKSKESLDGSEAALALLEGTLATAQSALHAKTKQVVGLAKVRFRKDAAKSRVFAGLRAVGTTVSTTRKSADDLAAAWAKADPDGGYIGTSLKDYNALRTSLSSAETAREAGRTGVKAARKSHDALLKSAQSDLTAWYAAAGRVFPESTADGKLLRAEIPT